MADEDLLFAELKAAERLPSPSGIALRALDLTSREDASLEDLARLIQADPALSARVLKFANSPLIAPRRPIVAIQEAVARIGTNGVRNLVLGLSLVRKYQTGTCRAFDYPRYWATSLATAVALARLATRQRTLAPEEAFTLGLLADIGRLALATAWPEEYAQCIRSAAGGQTGMDASSSLASLERRQFAIDHRSLTLLLLAHWGLPEVFRDAIAHQGDPAAAGDSRTGRIARQIAFARTIAAWCVDRRRADLLPELNRQAGDHGLDPDDLAGFLQEIETSWRSWGNLLEIATEPPEPEPEPTDGPEGRQPGDGQVRSTSARSPPLPGLDLVLVDDDPDLLARLADQLRQAGHRVRCHHDAQQALKAIFKAPPQLVLAGWSGQTLDGIALCRALRQSPLGAHLYLVLLTANENEDDLVRAFAAGIDDYVTMPVNPKVLLARIHAGQRIVALQEELAHERAELEAKAKQLSLANRRLEQLANTDLLTGLPNRRYAQRHLRQELAQAMRYHRPLSVMLLDLDHFKRINDSLGHATGDQVLKHTAARMQKALRISDTLCRWGGEEFIAIVPSADLAAARRLAERLRHALANGPPRGLPLEQPVTVSIGVASHPPARDVDDLLHRADEALYRAKAKGRNRTETA